MSERRVTFTREQIADYAEASGDQNPIHLDDDFARSVGLPGVIAHGMLQMGIAATVASEAAGGAGPAAPDVRPLRRHGRARRHGHVLSPAGGRGQARCERRQPARRSGADESDRRVRAVTLEFSLTREQKETMNEEGRCSI